MIKKLLFTIAVLMSVPNLNASNASKSPTPKTYESYKDTAIKYKKVAIALLKNRSKLFYGKFFLGFVAVMVFVYYIYSFTSFLITKFRDWQEKGTLLFEAKSIYRSLTEEPKSWFYYVHNLVWFMLSFLGTYFFSLSITSFYSELRKMKL